MITDAELAAEKAKLDQQAAINDIVLLSVADDDIVPVIKVVQEFSSDFDLKKSLQLVRSAPVTILSELDGDTAESAREKLEQAGAQVKYR